MSEEELFGHERIIEHMQKKIAEQKENSKNHIKAIYKGKVFWIEYHKKVIDENKPHFAVSIWNIEFDRGHERDYCTTLNYILNFKKEKKISEMIQETKEYIDVLEQKVEIVICK